MIYKFTKMHGCGNDYVYIDFRGKDYSKTNIPLLAQKVSDRHFGIGSDGLILICDSDKGDAKMRIFNADGGEATMCGNGIRCVAKYVYDTSNGKKNELDIETLSGVKHIAVSVGNGDNDDFLASVDMGKPVLEPALIPVNITGNVIGYKTIVSGREEVLNFVNMGNAHCVVFRDSIKDIDIEKEANSINGTNLFPTGVNIEFVRVNGNNSLDMRVWERGSGETLACGTGACASAVAAVLNGFCKKSEVVTVNLKGGRLFIDYTKENVIMTGPACTVFCGEYKF